MKDRKYRRGLQGLDEELKKTSSIENTMESNEILDYKSLEEIFDPTVETEVSTISVVSTTVLVGVVAKQDEASVFTQLLWNSFLQKTKN